MYGLTAMSLYIVVMASASIYDIRTRHVADWHWMVLGIVAAIDHVVCSGVCLKLLRSTMLFESLKMRLVPTVL